MSDTTATPVRPVSLFTIGFLFVVFAAFLLAVRYFYEPSTSSPHNAPLDNITKDEDKWRASAETRRATLKELQKKQAEQAASYGWVDQKAGVVRLPIDRAIDLVVQENSQPNRAPAQPRAGR